jgi:hypothetical protein
MLGVKHQNRYRIMASRGMRVTIMCSWLQARLQVKIVNKTINIPFL